MTRLPTLEVRPSTAAVDADVVPVFQDGNKKPIAPKGRYASLIERFRKGQVFAGRLGTVQFVRFGGKGKAESVLFVGMGPAGELNAEKARSAAGAAWSRLNAEKVRTVAIELGLLHGASGMPGLLPPDELLRGFSEGLVLGAYKWDKYRSKSAQARKEPEYSGPSRVTFVSADNKAKAVVSEQLKRAEAIARAVTICRDWSNEPPNFGTPEYFGDEAKRLSKELGLKCTVLDEKAAAKERMNLFLAVGRGSARESRVVVVEYDPKLPSGSPAPKTLALVGKGVTFDTGGISIKPALRMEEMKHDMTGAATVFAAVALAALWKVPNRVVGIMGFTENMPDGDAIVPGTVITARNGKTVEIINTDAEGRLILADMLDYAHEFKPDAIVNIATLTGAIGVSLGKFHAGLFSNTGDLVRALEGAGERTGEKMWELPSGDEYFEDLKSETADMKNVGNDTYGGSIRGAVFLKQFIQPKMPWAHLDIAYLGSNIGYLSYIPKKGATGLFVRTLAQLAADLS